MKLSVMLVICAEEIRLSLYSLNILARVPFSNKSFANSSGDTGESPDGKITLVQSKMCTPYSVTTASYEPTPFSTSLFEAKAYSSTYLPLKGPTLPEVIGEYT